MTGDFYSSDSTSYLISQTGKSGDDLGMSLKRPGLKRKTSARVKISTTALIDARISFLEVSASGHPP
ncbi:hypothetical protein PM082_022694 [Marasmius tenuissimus]|nr:hypothetical protein PM082_022694 [Marasmius tenuissimus]